VVTSASQIRIVPRREALQGMRELAAAEIAVAGCRTDSKKVNYHEAENLFQWVEKKKTKTRGTASR